MKKILRIFFLTSIAGCGQLNGLTYTQDCTTFFLYVYGNIDFVYGLPSALKFECPPIVHGTTIEWNKREIKKDDIDTNDIPISSKYGKEYGSIVLN